MNEMGMIATFLGEPYANFGYLGILLVPALLAYFLGRVYFRAYRSNYFSVIRLAYLLVACNLIQVYRDGLTSIVVFTWVNMMPLMVIVALHYVLPVRHKGGKLVEYAQAGYEKPATR
jgi:oligosaccharide repeat unit polymerase